VNEIGTYGWSCMKETSVVSKSCLKLPSTTLNLGTWMTISFKYRVYAFLTPWR
jgi:hypothetical protein